MRASYISGFFMILFSVSILFVTGCDTREEKVEIIPEVEGSLLKNGRVAPVTPEGAEELKEMISNITFIKQYRELFSELSEKDLEELTDHVEFRGEFQVIPRTTHYEVIFPDRTTLLPQEGEEFESIQFFHNMNLRVTPTGDPAAFQVEFEANEKPFYAVLNKDGKSTEFMNFTYETSEPHKALWHNDFQMFVQMTGSMRNATFNMVIPEEYRRDFDNIDNFKFTIADVRSDAMLEPDENNIWSGRYNANFDNIEITLPQSVGTVTVLKMSSDQDMNKLNPAVYSEFFSQYEDLMTGLYALESGSEDDIEFLPLMKAYKSLLTDGFESTDMEMKLSNIAVKLNKTPEDPHTMKSFGLEEASFAGSMKGAKDNAAKFDVYYKLEGIDVGMKQFEEEFGGETPQEMIPQNLRFGFGVENLPAVSLLDKAIAIFEQAEGDEQKIERMFMQSQDEFIKLLVDANTKMNIDDTYVGNEIWLLLMNGGGKMNPNSMLKVDGETEIRFYGMDYLMQVLDQRMKNPDTPPSIRMMLEQSLTGLGMMQMFGQQKKDDNGRDFRGYTITLTPEGSVQMNGTDMSQMMGMMR